MVRVPTMEEMRETYFCRRCERVHRLNTRVHMEHKRWAGSVLGGKFEFEPIKGGDLGRVSLGRIEQVRMGVIEGPAGQLLVDGRWIYPKDISYERRRALAEAGYLCRRCSRKHAPHTKFAFRHGEWAE